MRHPLSYRGARRNIFFLRKPLGNTKPIDRVVIAEWAKQMSIPVRPRLVPA